MGLEVESPAGKQKLPRKRIVSGDFLCFYELFCSLSFGETDRVADLLQTAIFASIICAAPRMSLGSKCV